MATKKRDWFVAIGDVGGEYAGGPLTFDSVEVYGPYTAEQALQLSRLDNEYPPETKSVRIFKVARPPFRSLWASLCEELAEIKADMPQPQQED